MPFVIGFMDPPPSHTHTQLHLTQDTHSRGLLLHGYRESLNRDKSSVIGNIESYQFCFLEIFSIIISNRDRLRDM